MMNSSTEHPKFICSFKLAIMSAEHEHGLEVIQVHEESSDSDNYQFDLSTYIIIS